MCEIKLMRVCNADTAQRLAHDFYRQNKQGTHAQIVPIVNRKKNLGRNNSFVVVIGMNRVNHMHLANSHKHFANCIAGFTR